MDITTLVGIAVLSAVLCIIVRQYKPEMALGISIACGVLIMGAVIAMLAPSVELISQLTGSAGLDGGYSRTLFKALAVCYITQLGSDCCKDAGGSAIAGEVEIAGKAAGPEIFSGPARHSGIGARYPASPPCFKKFR